MEVLEKKTLSHIVKYKNETYKIIGISGGKNKKSIFTLCNQKDNSIIHILEEDFNNAK